MRSLGVSMQNLKLMAEGDVLKEELPTGSEGGCKCEKDDFEHSNMLYSGPYNGNDTNADGIFGR